MTLATQSLCQILPLTEFLAVAGGWRLRFVDGSIGFLPGDQPNASILRIHAEAALRSPTRELGVRFDETGRVVDLGSVHESLVRSIVPLGGDRFQVGFWSISPVCGLSRDQPEFEHLREVLQEAIGTNRPVRLAIHATESVQEEPDEDGLDAVLPRILTVRFSETAE